MREISVSPSRHNIYGIGSWGGWQNNNDKRDQRNDYFLLIITINCELFYFRNDGCSVLLCRQSKLNLVPIIVWLNQQQSTTGISPVLNGLWWPNSKQQSSGFARKLLQILLQPRILVIFAAWAVIDATSKTTMSKTLLHFEAKFFGDFHSHGCYQSPSVSYTRRAGKASQHKNSSPERWWIYQAKYCSWVLGVQCLECSAYTAHPLLFLVHSLLCNINMRPMCAGDTLSRCRKDIFAEPSSDMLLL